MVVWILTLAVAAGVARRFDLLVVLSSTVVAAGFLLRRRLQLVLVALVACACGVLGGRSAARLAIDRAVATRVSAGAGSALVLVEGTVASFPQTGVNGTTFDFATALEGRRLRIQVRAERFDVDYGDCYRMRVRFLKPTPAGRRFLQSRGLCASARARSADMIFTGRAGSDLVRRVFWPSHRYARTRLARALGGEAGLAIGMLLGERGQIDDDVRDAVRRLGITHLLAISGMHLTTLAACVVLMTKWRPRWRAPLLLALLTVYTASVGNVESLTRAYLMALIVIATQATLRPVRAVDALGKALFVMAVAAPLSLLSVGLQLSFAATLAVLACAPLYTRTKRDARRGRASRWALAVLRPVCVALLLSLAVEVLIAPLQLHHFRTVSVAGPLATVVFFVPVTVVLLGAPAVVLLATMVPAAELPGTILKVASMWTNELIVACGRLAPAPVAIPEPNPWLYYGGLAIGWRFRRRPVAWVIAAALVGAALLC